MRDVKFKSRWKAENEVSYHQNFLLWDIEDKLSRCRQKLRKKDKLFPSLMLN